jgi:hypothetical protein
MILTRYKYYEIKEVLGWRELKMSHYSSVHVVVGVVALLGWGTWEWKHYPKLRLKDAPLAEKIRVSLVAAGLYGFSLTPNDQGDGCTVEPWDEPSSPQSIAFIDSARHVLETTTLIDYVVTTAESATGPSFMCACSQ